MKIAKGGQSNQRSLLNASKRRSGFLALFTIPTFIAFFIIVLLPLGRGLYYSFFEWSGLSTNMKFVGLDNYKRMFSDAIVWRAAANDLKIAAIRLVFTLVFSLGLALILTRLKVHANKFFRNILFFAVMLSVVVVTTIWMMLYNPSFGVLTKILAFIGIKSPSGGWLGDYKTALYATILPAIWCSVGFYMIIFISAIESIPRELFESSMIDGANKWREAKDIIFPLLGPQISFAAIYIVISSMNGSYLFVKLLTNGGPNNASEVLGTYMTTTGFNYHQFGYATTIAMLILVMTGVLAVILNTVFKSEAYEF